MFEKNSTTFILNSIIHCVYFTPSHLWQDRSIKKILMILLENEYNKIMAIQLLCINCGVPP